MKHYKSVEFLSNLNVKPHLHKHKPPRTNVKPVLTTYWRRFWLLCCSYTTISKTCSK